MKVIYSAVGHKAYAWHVVTGHGIVVAGEVVNRMGTWRAVITHEDGDKFTIPEGGVLTGYASARKAAVAAALNSYALGEAGRFARAMAWS